MSQTDAAAVHERVHLGPLRDYTAAAQFKQTIYSHLENRTVKEQSKQLDEVKEHVAILLLHPDDVGQREGPVGVDASVGRGGPGEEAKLEEVLHHNCQLGNSCWVIDQQIITFKVGSLKRYLGVNDGGHPEAFAGPGH